MKGDTPESLAIAHAPLSPEHKGRLMRLATYASVSVAAILIAAKLVAWLATDSIGLLSTLIDSLLDAGASLVNLAAVRQALQPADREHRFGHGKAEPLAGLVQAAFISGSAAFLLIQAVERLYRPRVITNTEVGLGVLAFSILLTILLVVFQRYVVLRTDSVAIKADSVHYKMDVLVNGSVIVSLLLASELGWIIADPLFAIAIAGYIFWGAWEIGYTALNILMDRELPDEDRQRIREIALAHPHVSEIHDLRTRSSGPNLFIQFHLEMDGDMTLHRAHEISDEVEAAVGEVFPHAEVLIHEDPAGLFEDHTTFR